MVTLYLASQNVATKIFIFKRDLIGNNKTTFKLLKKIQMIYFELLAIHTTNSTDHV